MRAHQNNHNPKLQLGVRRIQSQSQSDSSMSAQEEDGANYWRHPTGKNPKSVLVIALGPSKQDLLELTTAHLPNEDLMSFDEVWGVNGGSNHFGGRVSYDVMWVMDWIEGEARKEPRYGDHLVANARRHGTSIITSQATGAWADYEFVHEYPLQAVLAKVGTGNAYFHNSIPYILAYAYFIGLEKLLLFGADYAHEKIKHREADRPCAEYWVGYLRAKGVKVIVPSSTTLLNSNQGIWFYGYRDQPLLGNEKCT